jgi:hypothetical protein
MAISVIMGFPLIDRRNGGRPGVSRKIFGMRRLIPAHPAIAHLVETDAKIGVPYGNKFLPVAIMLQYSSQPGWYNLLKMNRRSAKRRQSIRNLRSHVPAAPPPNDASLLIR